MSVINASVSWPLLAVGFVGLTVDGIVIGQIIYWRTKRRDEYLEQLSLEENQ
jgi:hypothetical protein